MALARRLGRSWWIAGAPVFVALAVAVRVLCRLRRRRRDDAARERELAATSPRIERRRGRRRPRCGVLKVSDWTRRRRTRSPPGSARRRGSSSGTRCSTAASRAARSTSSSRTSSATCAAGTSGRALPGSPCFAFPLAFLVAERDAAPRRAPRPGSNLPLAFLVLTRLGLAAAPLQNAVSRRYEAEADWRRCRRPATRRRRRGSSASFERTSLQEPNPPAWDYVLLENHPTLAQRIAMAQRWRAPSCSGCGRRSRAGP